MSTQTAVATAAPVPEYEPHTWKDVANLSVEETTKRLVRLNKDVQRTARRKLVFRQVYKVGTYPAAFATVGYGAASGAGVLVAGGIEPTTAATLLFGGSLAAAVAKWWKPAQGEARNAVSRTRWESFANDVDLALSSDGDVDSKRRALLKHLNTVYKLKALDNSERKQQKATSSV